MGKKSGLQHVFVSDIIEDLSQLQGKVDLVWHSAFFAICYLHLVIWILLGQVFFCSQFIPEEVAVLLLLESSNKLSSAPPSSSTMSLSSINFNTSVKQANRSIQRSLVLPIPVVFGGIFILHLLICYLHFFSLGRHMRDIRRVEKALPSIHFWHRASYCLGQGKDALLDGG